jgi:SAM-dependent methyltransferase
MPFYDYYGELPATAAGQAWVRAQAAHILTALAGAAPQARSLFEIGPGRGIFADLCAARGLRYVALDINHRLLAATRERGHDGIRAVAPTLPVADGRFDIAFAAHVIEHSPDYRVALQLLEEMRRVVRPGGLVALVAPDYLALREDFWNCDYSHSFVTTRRRLRQIMRDSQLRVIDEQSLYGPLTGPAGIAGGALLGSRALGAVARAIPGRAGERLYKLRLTFARALLMIGQTPT